MNFKATLCAAASALVLSAGAAAALPATAETPLRLRAGPGPQFRVIGAVPAGATVSVRGCARGWCRVRFGGEAGYGRRTQLALGGGAAVAVAPGYAYDDGPYTDDYYDYGYAYGPSVGFYAGGDRFHRRGWDRGRVGIWNGSGQRWHGGSWSGNRGGFAEGGRSFQGGNFGGRATVNAPAGMPAGGGGFRGGGGGFHGGGAAMGGGASMGGGHAGGAVGGGGAGGAGHGAGGAATAPRP